jgi:cysteinyl-tRNA synthetase
VPQAPQAQQAPELISAEEIRRLLEEREELRRNRDYAGSDRLRDDLRAKGVSVNDREKSWVADDGRSGMFGTSVDMGGGGVSGESITTDEIMQILTDREAARASRDYAKGDQLRDQLRAKGIQVHDRERTWRAPDGRSGTFGGGGGGGFGGGGGGGGGYGGAMMGQAGPMNDYEIVKVLEQREEARKNRDYASSDRIRDELRARGVQVHDTERRWSTQDGRRYVLVAGETLITSAAKCAP